MEKLTVEFSWTFTESATRTGETEKEILEKVDKGFRNINISKILSLNCSESIETASEFETTDWY